jgi:hypothetical protein
MTSYVTSPARILAPFSLSWIMLSVPCTCSIGRAVRQPEVKLQAAHCCSAWLQCLGTTAYIIAAPHTAGSAAPSCRSDAVPGCGDWLTAKAETCSAPVVSWSPTAGLLSDEGGGKMCMPCLNPPADSLLHGQAAGNTANHTSQTSVQRASLTQQLPQYLGSC